MINNFLYFFHNFQYSKYELENVDEKHQFQNPSHGSFENITKRVLSTIRFRLQALLESKPFANKLHTNILIFRYERLSELKKTNLNNVSQKPDNSSWMF